MLRLFVAVELPEEVRQVLDKVIREMTGHAGARHVRWVNTHQAHLTVKFLGDAPESSVAALQRALSGVAGQASPFALTLAGVGAFPDCRRPRVIWVGLDAGEDAAAVRDLHGGLERDLARLGYAAENRPFSPHLTLGRVRQGLRPADVSQVCEMLSVPWEVAPVSFDVRAVSLMVSELRPSGAVHTRLFEARLGET